MKQARYSEEFKRESVRQITEKGHPVAEVAERLGVSCYSLYQWMKQYGTARSASAMRVVGKDDEIRRLREELKRVTEERNILKKAAAYFAKTSG
jgi:transposase